MINVKIQLSNDVFNLVDDNGNIVFSNANWGLVKDFAYGKFNIQYEPKDLIFDIGEDEDEGPYVYFDIKYGSSDGNLDDHNVINLPSFMYGALMECTFGYKESMSKKKVIEGLVAAGASYKQII